MNLYSGAGINKKSGWVVLIFSYRDLEGNREDGLLQSCRESSLASTFVC